MAARKQTVALVTGGARRIGEAIVRDLTANGFSVAIHCNTSRDAADTLAEEIKATGGHAVVVQADLCDRQALERLVPQAEAELGPVELVVNNASLFEDDSARSFEWETWDKHFDIHLKAPVALARAMAEALPEASDGLVVNIVDQRVWRPTPRFFSYTLSKSALWDATRTMAQAFAPRVRVNAIGPGPTLRNDRQDDGDFRQQVDALLLRRGPQLAEFGETIRYLWQTRSVDRKSTRLNSSHRHSIMPSRMPASA